MIKSYKIDGLNSKYFNIGSLINIMNQMQTQKWVCIWRFITFNSMVQMDGLLDYHTIFKFNFRGE